jgi:hypothetical protein
MIKEAAPWLQRGGDFRKLCFAGLAVDISRPGIAGQAGRPCGIR